MPLLQPSTSPPCTRTINGSTTSPHRPAPLCVARGGARAAAIV